jgi:pimeloyl-ACP methyl ester carboxylesterase
MHRWTIVSARSVSPAAKIGAEWPRWCTGVETKKGTRCRVLEGGSGAPLVFLHGAGGLLRDNPFLDQLAQGHHVFAPEWPGYGESAGEELLEDMLDFTLHGWDLVEALGLEQPHLVGHSMGGMIAAEMACSHDVAKLVLVSRPACGWTTTRSRISSRSFRIRSPVLFHDPQQGQALLTGGADLSDMEALKDFYIGSQRRLAMAGKILFPIPNRRLSKRLYRLTAETLVLWGASDRLIVPAYAERWKKLIPHARVELIGGAAHMLPYEQPDQLVRAVTAFLQRTS